MFNFDTTRQKEALLNEFKGNLFEFMVARFLAEHWNIESQFYSELNPEFMETLRSHEAWLREQDRLLLGALGPLAQSTAKSVQAYLEQHDELNCHKVYVVGKVIAGSGKYNVGEADLILVGEQKTWPISIKLGKGGSYVNTKSAGIGSFFTRYFDSFARASLWQEQLNILTRDSFLQMGQELYDHHELGAMERFDSRWDDAGCTHLPGELDERDSEKLFEHYLRLSTFVRDRFIDMAAENKEEFFKQLLPLMGLLNSEVVQVTCYYHRDKDGEFHQGKIQVLDLEQLTDELKSFKLDNDIKGNSSIELLGEHYCLQVRIKPMNKFTTQSYKMNCSVKSLGGDTHGD